MSAPPSITKGKTTIAFKADKGFADALDRVVRRLDTDRSKFIRAAIRKEVAKAQIAD